MKKGAQSKKANAYENKIAKLFTAAFYTEEDGSLSGEFRRAPKSGGWDKRLIPADLVALKYTEKPGALPLGVKSKRAVDIDKIFRFSVECKTWADKNVKHFVSGLYSADSGFFVWMEQAIEDASYSKKTPLVVFKLYGVHNVVEILYSDFSILSTFFGNFPGKMYVVGSIIPETKDGKTYVFALLADFLEWIDWDMYKNLVSKGEIK